MVPETAVPRRRRALAGVLGTVLTFGLLALPATPPAAAAYWDNVAAAGEHTMVVLPVYWTTPDAQTTGSLRAVARQVGEFWSAQTNGMITLPDARITVRDWMQIDPPVDCDRNAIFYAALTAANERAGSYHKHVVVYFPQTPLCSWTGSASVYPEYEGNIYHQVYGWMWINGYAGADVWEREFGRNLGIGHARTAACTSGGVQVPLSANCATREDSDYDVMSRDRGGDGFTLNTALADLVGLLDPTAVRDASVGASYTLAPVGSHTGIRAVKVHLPDDSFLYLEYRPSVGRDAGQPPGWSGVQVRQRGRWDTFSRLLALNPDGTDGLLANAAARVGVGWRIPGTYLELVVDSQDASGARIRFPALPDTTPPAAPAAPNVLGTATLSAAAQAAGIIGGPIGVSWPSLDDPDSGLASFTIHLDDEVVRTVVGTATGVLLPALPGGVHRIRLDATNNAGMTTPGPETVFTTATAPPAPVAPTVTGTTYGSQLSGEVTLTWSTVDDPDLTGYQIEVDGELLGTVGPQVGQFPVGALSTGDHSARVVAVNGMGLGTASEATGFRVDASAPPAPAAPTVTAGTQAAGFLRGDLQVSWPSVLDADSGIEAYRLFVDDALVATTATGGHPVPVGALASGSHRIRVDTRNGAGLTSAGAVTTVRVDNAAPVLGGLVIALRPGPAGGGIPVTVTAPARDEDSGIATVATTVNGRPVGSGSSVATTVPPGGAASVQVTATDLLGNVAAVAGSFTVAPVAETAGRYSRGWVVRRSAAYAGGAARVPRKRGASVTYTFSGSQVGFTGSTGPRSGTVSIYLDGKRVGTLSTRGPAAHRQLLWATSTVDGRHTLKVVVNRTPPRTTLTLDSFLSGR